MIPQAEIERFKKVLGNCSKKGWKKHPLPNWAMEMKDNGRAAVAAELLGNFVTNPKPFVSGENPSEQATLHALNAIREINDPNFAEFAREHGLKHEKTAWLAAQIVVGKGRKVSDLAHELNGSSNPSFLAEVAKEFQRRAHDPNEIGEAEVRLLSKKAISVDDEHARMYTKRALREIRDVNKERNARLSKLAGDKLSLVSGVK